MNFTAMTHKILGLPKKKYAQLSPEILAKIDDTGAEILVRA
jgi:hypothetical protein